MVVAGASWPVGQTRSTDSEFWLGTRNLGLDSDSEMEMVHLAAAASSHRIPLGPALSAGESFESQ